MSESSSILHIVLSSLDFMIMMMVGSHLAKIDQLLRSLLATKGGGKAVLSFRQLTQGKKHKEGEENMEKSLVDNTK